MRMTKQTKIEIDRVLNKMKHSLRGFTLGGTLNKKTLGGTLNKKTMAALAVPVYLSILQLNARIQSEHVRRLNDK